MKKMTAAVLTALMLCAPALAMDNLMGTALVGDGLLYYAGSLDGKTQGVYAMDPDGQNPRLLFAGDASLLAGNADTVLLCDLGAYADGGTVLMGRDGSELLRLGIQAGSAIEAEGRYFVGSHVLWLEDGECCERAYLELADDQQWMIQPVCALGETLYYLDSTRYANQGVEGAASIGKLMRTDLVTGETAQVSPEGSAFLGMWEGRAVYTRQDFYIYAGDDAANAGVDAGLFLEGEAGGAEVRLAGADAQGDVSTYYSLLAGDVVYGMTVDYSQEEPSATLKRVRLSGEALPDVEIPAGALSAASGATLYLCANRFVEEDGFSQRDQILALNTETGETACLNEGRAEAIFYSEATPRYALQNGKVYYLDFDGARSAVRLCAIAPDGADYAVLAKGYEWENA